MVDYSLHFQTTQEMYINGTHSWGGPWMSKAARQRGYSPQAGAGASHPKPPWEPGKRHGHLLQWGFAGQGGQEEAELAVGAVTTVPTSDPIPTSDPHSHWLSVQGSTAPPVLWGALGAIPTSC